MEAIKKVITTEEIVGYKSFDGQEFKEKEECEKYEGSAIAVIKKRLNSMAVSIDSYGCTFSECEIFENYGYGSEEYQYMVVDIKNEDDLKAVNQYYELIRKENNYKENDGDCLLVPDRYIGKRTMICIGSDYDVALHPCPKTMEELIENFTKDISNFFLTQEEKEAKKNNKKEEN